MDSDEEFLASRTGRAAHARKRMSMEKVKSYLDENYKEHITLELLSQKFYINKYYLTKIFKETYGVTIISYLETRRITQAKNLLRFTDMTVDEISAAIGMNDANYLARRFRKIEGMSPGEYRKNGKTENRKLFSADRAENGLRFFITI